MLFEYLPRKNTLRCAVGQVKPVPLQEEATCSATRAISRRCARSRQVKGVLRTLKHGQNRTSCVFDKRYAEQQCRRNSRQRRKFAPPGASQKKGAISEFPTKGYPPNLRVVAQRRPSCLVLYAPLAGRTLPAGEGGCAAGWLPPSHYLNNGPAVRCRSSPEFPFRFIWVLGWSTWYLWPIKS